MTPGPEQFVNIQGLLVQSSKWFGIRQVQFSYLVGKVPFVGKARSVQLGARRPSASVQFVPFISRTLPARARIDLAGSVPLRLGLVYRVANCSAGAQEQF